MKSRHLSLGRQGEKLAEKYLKKNGYRILARNYRCRSGEIDLVAEEGRTLVFIEVKTRSNASCGHPLEGIDLRKQGRLSRAAGEYLLKNGDTERPCRFDAVSVLADNNGTVIELVKNAFEQKD